MNHLEKVTLMYLKETFSSHLLHTILLIIEYYPLIFLTLNRNICFKKVVCNFYDLLMSKI